MNPPSDPDKPSHGLSPRQLAFADAYAQALAAGVTFTQADLAEAAGYTGSKQSLEVAGSRCLAHPRVIEYLHGKAKAHLRAGAMGAAITLTKLSTKAESERVRADVASRLAVGLGLIEGERGESGPAVAIQLVFSSDAGRVLVHTPADSAKHQQQQAIRAPARSLTEGEGTDEVDEGGGEGS